MMKYTPGENQFFNYFLQRNAIILLKLECDRITRPK